MLIIKQSKIIQYKLEGRGGGVYWGEGLITGWIFGGVGRRGGGYKRMFMVLKKKNNIKKSHDQKLA